MSNHTSLGELAGLLWHAGIEEKFVRCDIFLHWVQAGILTVKW